MRRAVHSLVTEAVYLRKAVLEHALVSRLRPFRFAHAGLAALVLACSGGHGVDRAGGAAGASRTLSIRGSDTMVILVQRWAEAYMAADRGAVIQVAGGGSGTGIAALVHGTTDIAASSRRIRDQERAAIAARRGAEVHEVPVALDAIAIYVHRDNPIASLALEDLARIYRGRVRRWSEVGGPDRPIVLYSRENSSGTYAYFKERVLGDLDFAAEAQTLPGTAAVIHAVSRDPRSIGYGGIGYGEGVRTLAIANGGSPPIAPSLENATRGAYPLARHLYLYTVGEPSGLSADFLEWVRSPQGQRLVEETGFYPLPGPPEQASAEVAR